MSQTETFEAGKLGQDLLTAGRNLWLAGLGAVAGVVDADRQSRARFEQVVDELVEKGRPVEERRRQNAEAWRERAGERRSASSASSCRRRSSMRARTC
jgi:hypothetical protein